MSDANSVLFNSNDPYYQPDDPSPHHNLQYYQSEYPTEQTYNPTPATSGYQNYGYAPSSPQNYDAYAFPSPMAGGPVEVSFLAAFGSGGLPGEPPLLEELDINFSHVKTKTFTVLNPIQAVDPHIMDDVDLVGPLVFCILLGVALFISGRSSFGSIYGVAVIGCLSIYGILNLMSENGLDFYRTASVLGYCLLPIVLLAIVSTVLTLGSLQFTSQLLAPPAVIWATFAASKIFVSILNMQDQRLLVAYPVALLYACFSLITIF